VQSSRTHKCVRALRARASCAPLIFDVMSHLFSSLASRAAWHFALGIAALACVNAVAANAPPSGVPFGHVVTYGLYHSEVIAQIPNKSVFGKVDELGSARHIETTSEVPCSLGTRFGVTFEIRNVREERFPLDLDVVWTHPKLTTSEGVSISRTEHQWEAWNAKGNHLSWLLEEEFERESGEWTIAVSALGEKLIEKRFTLKCPAKR
jgi:hypothetical protein